MSVTPDLLTTVPAGAPGDADPASPVDAFAERVLGSVLGFMECASIVLGDRLGWYPALARAGQHGLTPTELAAATGTHERYAREWLEQQAVAGILHLAAEPTDPGPTLDDPTPARELRFVLPAHAAEVLTDPASLAFMSPVPRMLAASMVQLPHLLDAYRTGTGVSWDQFGDEARDSQGDVNRPIFQAQLAEALAGVERVHRVLSRPGARIADVACGHGWSSLALARAYPQATVVGIDIDAPSVERARNHAAEAGLHDRVTFHTGDAAEVLDGLDAFDGVLVFEALHDMPHPVAVLEGVRRSLSDDGVAVVMDEAVAETFAADGDEVERLMYGYSLLVCLPDSMSAPGSAATGTVLRLATVQRYARGAGFAGAEVLPVGEFGFFRFYELTR